MSDMGEEIGPLIMQPLELFHAFLLTRDQDPELSLGANKRRDFPQQRPVRDQILACHTKNELEDLYLPYRPKRKSKASIARQIRSTLAA